MKTIEIIAKYKITTDKIEVWINGIQFTFSEVFAKGNTGYTKYFYNDEYCYAITGCASEGRLNHVELYLFEAPTKDEINFNDPILFIENISI